MALLLMVSVPEIYAKDYSGPDAKAVIDGVLTDITVEVSDDIIYVPVRDISETFGSKVYWSTKLGVTLYYNQQTFKPDFHLYESKAMVPLQYLSGILGFEYEYFSDFNVLALNSGGKTLNEGQLYAILPSYDGYSAEDLEWLSKIIHAEAKGEPYEAKIAVGSVILNRMSSGMYPDTIKGVIFDSKNGVQFTPTVNGSIYNAPSAESWMAALEVLEGKTNADNALFFINPQYAKSSWVSRNREYAFTMTNHDFYY